MRREENRRESTSTPAVERMNATNRRSYLKAAAGVIKNWADPLVVVLASTVFGVYFFWGLPLSRPLSFIDFSPWPSLNFHEFVAISLSNWRTSEIPGQGLVGTGLPNYLTPMLAFQSILSSAGIPSTLAQLSFVFLLFPVSALGFYLFTGLFSQLRSTRVGAGILYAVNPFFTVGIIGSGNPYGAIWYAILPLTLFTAALFLRSRRAWHLAAYGGCLLMTTILGPEYVLMSVFLAVMPIGLGLWLFSKSIGKLSVLTMFTFSIIAVVSLVLVGDSLYLQQYAITGAAAAHYGSELSGFPTGGTLLLLMFPAFNSINPATPSLIYYNRVATNPFWSVVILSSLPILILAIPSTFKNGKVRAERGIPLTLAILFIALEYALGSGLAPVIFGYIPGSLIVDSFIKISQLFLIFASAATVLTTELVVDLVSANCRTRDHGIRSMRRKQVKTRPPNHAAPRPETVLLATLVVCCLSLTSVGLFIPYNFTSITQNTVPNTSEPFYISQASTALNSLVQARGLQSGLTLWMPIDGGSGIQNAIIAGDPHALFFPAAPPSGNSSFAMSFEFYLQALNTVVSGHGTDFGRVAADLNVATIVVLTVNYSANAGYNSTFTSPYFGTPQVIVSGFTGIAGNFQPLLRYMKSQADLQVGYAGESSTIFVNLDWVGPVGSSQSELVSNYTESSNAKVLATLPGWTGPAPITAALSGTRVAKSVDNSTVLLQAGELGSPSGEGSTIGVMNSTVLSELTGSQPLADPLSPDGYAAMLDPEAVSVGQLRGANPIVGPTLFENGSLFFDNKTYIIISQKLSDSLPSRLQVNFTVSVWVRSSDKHSNAQTIFSQGTGIVLNSQGPDLQMFVRTTNGLPPTIAYVPYVANSWYLLTLVRNGSSLTAYENDSIVLSTSVNGTNIFLNTPFYLGSDGTYESLSKDRNWSGEITNLRVFSSPLNESQVSAIYSAGPTGSTALDPSALLMIPLTRDTIIEPSIKLSSPTEGLSGLYIFFTGSLELSGTLGQISLESNQSIWSTVTGLGSLGTNIELFGQGAIVSDVVTIEGAAPTPLLESLTIHSTSASFTDESHLFVQVASNMKWVLLMTTYDSNWQIQVNGSTQDSYQAFPGDEFYVGPHFAPIQAEIEFAPPSFQQADSLGPVGFVVLIALIACNVPTRLYKALRRRTK